MAFNRIARLAAAAAVTIATGTAAFGETVTIRYSNWLPPGFFLWEKALHPWVQEIEKVTEGRVKVEVLPKVVGTVASQFDVVRDGLADMAFLVPAYTPGRFELIEFGEMPLLSNKEEVIAPAFDRLYRKHLAPLNEFEGIEVLSIFSISPAQVFTKTRPVKAIGDFQGLKMRSPTSGTKAFLDATGGVTVNKPSSEAFEMLASGVIDGQLTQANTVTGFGQTDLTKYALLLPGGVSNSVNVVGINPAKWAEISEADRAAILAISQDKLAQTVGDVYAEAEDAAMATLKEAGYDITEASPEMVAELSKMLAPIEASWVERAKAKGLADPAAVLQEYRDIIAAAGE